MWITVYAAASTGRIGVFIKGNAAYYQLFSSERAAIEAQIGEPLAWIGDGNPWSIDVYRRADPTNRADWPSQHQTLATWLDKFIRVFKPYVSNGDGRV